MIAYNFQQTKSCLQQNCYRKQKLQVSKLTIFYCVVLDCFLQFVVGLDSPITSNLSHLILESNYLTSGVPCASLYTFLFPKRNIPNKHEYFGRFLNYRTCVSSNSNHLLHFMSPLFQASLSNNHSYPIQMGMRFVALPFFLFPQALL